MVEETDYLTPNVAPGVIFFLVLTLLTLWATFWIIRLAVRYGMNDALRMNRDWLRLERSSSSSDD